MRDEWKPIYNAAIKVITEVMEAGEKQRLAEGKPTDEWTRCDPAKRLHHAFMHLVNCKTHESAAGNPWVLADNTRLEQYKHALCGLAIVAAHEDGFMDAQEGAVVDTTEDEIKGE